MNPRFCLAALLILSLTAPGLAKKPKQQATPASAPGQMTVVAVSPGDVTLDPGNGADQLTYPISDATKITLDGSPITVDQVMAGMQATISVGADKQTLLTLDLTDAHKDPQARRPRGKGPIFW